jgi:hypothetical protein
MRCGTPGAHSPAMAHCNVLFFGLTAVLLRGSNDPLALTAEQILSKLAAAEEKRDQLLQSYEVTRTYRLASVKSGQETSATAAFQYRQNGGKKYEVLEERGADGMYRWALHKVMQAEVTASKSEQMLALTTQNYTAELVGRDQKDGHDCFLLNITPKRKSKYLLKGKAWIDVTEFGLVRMEGRPTESLSFWVGKPYITQSFAKVGPYWLLSNNTSLVDARFVGRMEFSITSKGYAVQPAKKPPTAISQKAKRLDAVN